MFTIAWMIGYAVYALAVLVSCRAIIPWLGRHRIVDEENDRTSHRGAVARGGGFAFILLLLIALTVSVFILDAETFWWTALLVFLGFAGVAAFDDLKNLNPLLRLVLYFTLSVFLVFSLPVERLPGAGLIPETILRGLLVLVFLWWVNLFNFMDGIDGLASIESISLSVGLVFLLYVSFGPGIEVTASIFFGITGLAFLTVNWHPARLFMGDVGSITLAAISGFLMLLAASAEAWGIAIILPLYFWLDASTTLVWRIVKREKFWLAHRQHAYQKFVASGHSHRIACWYVAGLNVALLFLATNEFTSFWLRLLIAIALTSALLVYFRSAKPAV